MSGPLLIAEWPRNKREVIRVTIDAYKGSTTIDIRTWFRSEDGEVKPTRVGITASVRHLPALADAIGKALAEARARGLLDDGGAS